MNITTPCLWDSSESSGIRALAVTCAAACPDKRIGAGDILSECRHMRLQRFFPPSLCVDDLLLSSPHRSDSFAAKRLFPKLTLRHRRSLRRSRPTRKVPFLFYIQSSWDHVSDPPNRTTGAASSTYCSLTVFRLSPVSLHLCEYKVSSPVPDVLSRFPPQWSTSPR